MALGLSACRSQVYPRYPAGHREYAYIPNGASGTTTVLDIVNLRIDGEIAVGPNPVAVTASPTRNEVYIVNSGVNGGPGSLSVIDAAKNQVSATIALHRKPVSIDLDATGAFAYISNSASNSVSVVDLNSGQEIAQIGAGEDPVAARITPDGNTLVVANHRGNSVSIVDVPRRKVRSIFPGCPGAQDVAILPDSSKAFIACADGHQVMAIALARPTEPSPHPDQLQAMLDVGRGPVQLAIKPDGGEIFVSNSLSNSISEIDTSKNDVGGAYMIGDEPVRGLVSSDNALLYVANFDSQYVTIFSIDEGKRLPASASIHVGDGPQALAFSSRGQLLFVVDNRSSDVAVVRTDVTSARTDARPLFSILPTGRAPNAIAIKAFEVK